VGLSTDLDAVAKTRISAPAQNQTPILQSSIQYPRHETQWAARLTAESWLLDCSSAAWRVLLHISFRLVFQCWEDGRAWGWYFGLYRL